jgi:magnesium transporter
VAVATTSAAGATALLFRRHAVVEVDDWARELDGLGRSSILWIDLERPDEAELGKLAETLELDEGSVRALTSPGGEPFFADFGEYLHVAAHSPCRGDGPEARHELELVGCLVSKRWVVTVHEGDVPVLASFREQAAGSGDTGRLDGLEFLANLLAWVLEGYLDAFEEIEVALEKVDARAMQGQYADPDDALGELVTLRKEVGRLRRALVSHRQMFLALTRPELAGMSSDETAERFAELRGRLEEGVQAARDSRDSIFGSFDVLLARTGHRTNEIMKVLTLASVLFLPGALVAGLLGMNFEVGLFDHAGLFWVVVATIVVVAASTLVAARRRRWI